MNKYPRWWNSTLTLYNKIVDTETDAITWQRTVLTNCFWKQHVNTDYQSGQAIEIDSPIITCRIPKDENFVDTYTWKQLSTLEKIGKFTLQNGDIIINGLVEDIIDEYTKGYRSSDVVNKYKDKGVLTLSLYVDDSDNSRLIPHYFVR